MEYHIFLDCFKLNFNHKKKTVRCKNITSHSKDSRNYIETLTLSGNDHGQTKGQTDGQTDGHTDRRTDGRQTDGQMDNVNIWLLSCANCCHLVFQRCNCWIKKSTNIIKLFNNQ